MPEDFPLSPETFRDAARASVDWAADYYEHLAERPLIVPTTSEALRTLLSEPLPRSGEDIGALLETVDGVISRFSRHPGHPRFFGYVASPGSPVTALGSLLASVMNLNVTCWRSSPAATEIEHTTVNWLKEMLGYPATADGLLVSGGSMANFAGLAAARSAKAPGNVVHDGVAAAGKRMCIYVSEEGHFSIAKAAGMLGLGEANVRAVPTDEHFRIDLRALDRLVEQDRAAGYLPICVVANAGTTATGAFDPIGEVAEAARRHNLWLHVDGAYGGFSALAPSVRHLFDGIAEADSVALDPHKWLYMPVGCGSILYKDPESARAAFAHDAEYTRPIGMERDEAFVFWDYGPALSRPFRALELWLQIKSAGADRLGEAIERNLACARYLEKLVKASGDFEMLAPVELSVFCFRYAPRNYAGDLDALNERILVEVQRGGSTFLSNARVRGKFALRGCVLNYRTTERDMEIALEDVRRAAKAI
jgi:glutamate/tyrosine decarboxylase-like PLP-dependent enzyme